MNDVEVYGRVVELQRLLADRGFRAGTRAAVQGFQRANGCDDDGIVGNQTWAALRGGSAPEGIGDTERDAWGVGTAVEREFDERPTP